MVALLAFGVGCDTGDNNLPTKPVEEECYIGTLSVDQNDGTFYYQSNVKTTYEISAEGRLSFAMYNVKFAEGMPIKLNMFVDGVGETIQTAYQDYKEVSNEIVEDIASFIKE